MYLNSLKLNGFKSFAESCIFKFDGGITCVVGPNGCGKTNIVDSIRWVLGEQRVSLLRGEKMEEVIFNGTSEMKPLGMAEVSLEFDNRQGVFPLDYDSILVTRRLYRSGESEYLLNKQPCRLKDINNLILNTGVGPHAYSVIQQNMVEAILSDKTDDRRFLFEEAAGISGYKIRRKETLRKLETVSSDLLRINDIASEIEKQVNSLRRQSLKAERYKKYSQELQELGLQLLSFTYGSLKDKLAKALESKRETSDQLEQLRAGISRIEAKYEEKRSVLDEIRSSMNDISSDLAPIESELIAKEKQYTLNEQRSTFLEDNLARLNSELEKSRIRIQELSSREQQLRSLIEKNVVEISRAEAKFKELDSELLTAENELEEKRQQQQPIREQLEKAGNQAATVDSKLNGLRSLCDEYQGQIESLINKNKNLTSRLEQSELDRTKLIESRSRISEEMKNLESEKDSLLEQRKNVKEQLANIEGEIQQELNKNSSISAKLETLTELESQYEGFREGAKTVLSRMKDTPGLKGTVAEKLNIPKDLVAAVETALGQDAELILCASFDDAFENIDILRNAEKGSAGFLVENHASPPTELDIPEQIRSSPGYEGRLSEKISNSSNHRLLNTLFANVILFNDRASAKEVSEQLVPGLSIVTRKGERFRWSGLVDGGNLGSESSIVGRRAAVEALDEQLQASDNKIAQLRSKAGDLGAEELQIGSKIDNLEQELSLRDRSLKDIEQKLSMLESDRKHYEELKQSNNREIQEISGKLDSVKANASELERSKQELTSEYERLKNILADQNKELEESERIYREVNRSANSAKVHLVNLESEKKRHESELNNNLELQTRSEENINQYVKELEESKEQLEKLKAERMELSGEIKELNVKKDEFTGKLNKVKGDYAEVESEIKQFETELNSLRSRRDELQKGEHELSLEIKELESDARYQIQKAVEEYGADLKEFEPPGESWNAQEAQERAEELSGKIQRMGAVNMLALEDYEKSKDRLDFITKQQSDLAESRDSLRKVIGRINKTAAEKFLTNFELIRQNFRRVFNELFEGGQADVVLQDPRNPLESPIEIEASPKGKKIVSLTQLSGGERALTAIALLFGIYFVKPSPFCFLDEVDAPLDDNNLRRFLKVLKKFSASTQFVIITHNKLTMEASDTLYGVTMEKPGVSKLVSVRFEDETNRELTSTGTEG